MTSEQLKALAVWRDEKVRDLVRQGADEVRVKEEVKKLVRDHKAMETTLYLMTDSLLKYAYNRLFSEFDKLELEINQANKTEEKFALIEKLNELHTYWHDLLVELTGVVSGGLSHTMGVEALAEGMHEAGVRQEDDLTGALGRVGLEKRLAIMARIMNSHMGQATYEEDDEKYIIINDPCGSGGRLWRKGLYEPEGRIKMVAEPHPITLGRSNFPSYCTHCPSWMVIIGIESTGSPNVVIYPPESPGDKCIWHLYKDPAKIPAEYLKLVE